MTLEALQTSSQTSEITAIFRNILVATDFSPASRRATRDALVLAARHHARVSLIHVLHRDRQYGALEQPPELDLARADAESQLQTLVSEISAQQSVETILIKHGPVAEVVAAVIEERAIDLLVIGTRGRGGLRKLALGSVAEELLRVARCPVMTIGPKATVPDTKKESDPRTIVFATDFGAGSLKAIPLALDLAHASGATLVVVHMLSAMPATTGNLSAYAPASAAADEVKEWAGASRTRALDELKGCVSCHVRPGQEIKYVVGSDFLPEGLLTAAAKYNAGLIVMGANHTGAYRLAAHMPWSAVHEVIEHATCPVLTVGV
jgi:nucleotide-binding universal stress UspA family protein